MPKRSTLDWALETLAIALLLGMFVNVAMHWDQLPELIPRHFNAGGNPDRWGNKDGIWTLPIVGFALYCGLTVLSRFPAHFNVPFAVDRTSPEVLSLLRRPVIAIKTVMVLMFAYISWITVRAALDRLAA